MHYKRKPEYVRAFKWTGYTEQGLQTFIKNHDLDKYSLRLGEFAGEKGVIFDIMGSPVICTRGSWLVIDKDNEMRTLSNKRFTTIYIKTTSRRKQ